MPRTCSICAHPKRGAIDVAIAAGTSYRDLAGQFHVSKTAVARHASTDVPASIAKAQEAREEAQALDVVRQLKAINTAALEILAKARKIDDPDTQLKAIDRIQRQIELQAKLLGDLDERPQVNVLLSAEWISVRTVLLAALAPFPDARVAAATALLQVEGNGHVARG